MDGCELMNGTKKLEWLEVMRGFAALWVLLHHANPSVHAFVGPSAISEAVGRNGFLGVDFFFVLSGFIIAFSSNRLVEAGRGAKDYALARLTRIYVPYLPVGLAMLALYAIAPGLSEGGRNPGLLTSVTLLPSNSPTALSVAWTLVHEVIFYAIFSLFFLSKRLLYALLVAWGCVIAGVYFSLGSLGRLGVGYLISPLNLCFLVGVATYYATRRGVPGALGLALGTVGLAIVLWAGLSPTPNRVLVAFGFACLVAFAASERMQGVRQFGLLRHLPSAQPSPIGVRSHGALRRSRHERDRGVRISSGFDYRPLLPLACRAPRVGARAPMARPKGYSLTGPNE